MSLFHGSLIQGSDANGTSGSGYIWKFYLTGTSTPANVYSDFDFGTSLGAMVTANSAGRFVPIYLNDDVTYRAVLCNAAGTPISPYDIDPVDSSATEAFSASGGSALLGFIQSGTGAVASTGQAKMRERLSVFDFMPDAVRDDVADNTITTDVVTYVDAASAAAVAQGRALHFPAGTYTMETWLPPANLAVVTDGRATIFKQMDTGGVQTPLIHVTTDNVSLWPGGEATLDGSIDTVAVNATEQNHGIKVEAQSGVTINRFACGDTYGKNIGGDVLVTYSPGGTIGHCTIGTLYGYNIYRNICSITGGVSGTITGVIQHPGAGVGCGLGSLFFEPDPANTSAPVAWTVGVVRGRTVSIVGDPAVRLGAIRIDNLHLDFDAYGVSTPAYDEGGINLALSPDQFLNAMRLRNFSSLDIGQAYIKGHTRCAIYSFASASNCDLLRFGSLILKEIDAASGNGEILLDDLRKFQADVIVDVDKASMATPTFVGASATLLIEVNGGEIEGRVTNGTAGDIDFNNVRLSGLAAENIFRNVDGRIRLRGGTGTGTPTGMFENCPFPPVVEDWTGDGVAISGTTVNVRYIRSTVNAISYADAWAVTQAAVASAATITLPKYGDVIPISGTTNITAITADAGNKGRRVTLVFAAALTFTDGGSLALAGNLVTTADDTITIATADGTTWYEVCRSVN